MQLAEDLQWAVENEVVIKIIKDGSVFLVHAYRGRISAQYAVDLDDSTSLAGALWAAIHSLKDGTEYHRLHGFTPGLDIDPSEIGM